MMNRVLIEKTDLLKRDVLKMGELALSMLRDSVNALEHKDETLADSVLGRKSEIAKMDAEIEEQALKLIALHHPVAKDMRTIAASLKMITYIARIGRYAKDIAKTAKLLSSEPHIANMVEIPYMAEIVESMIRDSLRAFQEEQLEYIRAIEVRDDKVDSLYYSIFRECLTYMMENSRNIGRCIHYIIIARYLERCGDHACKMAEKVHYMVTGEHVEIR
jgi:phosphate transport system protein